MIEVDGLRVERAGRLVLDQIGFSAAPGRILGVVGPNGAGKSTLLHALHRALPKAIGEVYLDGTEIGTFSRREIARRIAIVAQSGEAELPLRVQDAVMLGRLPHSNLYGYGGAADQQIVASALQRVGLSELADRLITELSGGERQRALIARAIVQQAEHLLLDEPTNHLDIHHQFALLDLVSTLGSTTMVVLHDLNLAVRYCDQVILLAAGGIDAIGTPEEVFTQARLERVYRVGADVVHHRGRPHLLFTPAAS